MHEYYVALCLIAEHFNPIEFPGTYAALEHIIKDEYDTLNGANPLPFWNLRTSADTRAT